MDPEREKELAETRSEVLEHWVDLIDFEVSWLEGLLKPELKRLFDERCEITNELRRRHARPIGVG